MAGLNRYPEPHPHVLAAAPRRRSTACRPTQLLPGRGSDESIDLLVRGFCRAGVDNVDHLPADFRHVRGGRAHPGRGGARSAAACASAASRSTPPACSRPATPTRRSSSCARLTTRRAMRWIRRPSSSCWSTLAGPRAGGGRRGLHRVLRRRARSRRSSRGFRISSCCARLSKAFGLAGARVGSLIAAARNRRAARQGDSALFHSAAHHRGGARDAGAAAARHPARARGAGARRTRAAARRACEPASRARRSGPASRISCWWISRTPDARARRARATRNC